MNVLKDMKILSVPAQPGAAPGTFSTTAYLNGFGLEEGTGRLVYPQLKVDAGVSDASQLQLPEPTVLTPDAIPNLWHNAEALVAQAKRFHQEAKPLAATNNEWHVEDFTEGALVDIINENSGQWVGFSGVGYDTLGVYINRNNANSQRTMDLSVGRDAVEKMEFWILESRDGLTRMQQALGLLPSSSIHDLAMTVATQLYRSGLYFQDVESLRVRGGFSTENPDIHRVELVTEGLRIEGGEERFVHEPLGSRLAKEDRYYLSDSGVTIQWGLSEYDDKGRPTFQVHMNVPGTVKKPLRSPIFEKLWYPIPASKRSDS